jgi:23S rRNA (uracil1939-C5)-methyltransferase
MLLVDSFEPAIQRVREAATAQDLTIEAWAHDATDAVTRLVDEQQTIDAIVLDPPRRGVPPQLRQGLAALAPKAIVYVSCGPETFARDLSHLAFLGYAAQRITPFDLIPLSEEVECVALLTASAPASLTVLHEDAQVVVIDKPPHLPTTPHGEHETSLLSIARIQFSAPNLTAVHRLDAGTSGACILAKQTAHVHAWSQALAAGEKRYCALVRGIIRNKGSVKRALRDGSRMLDARTRYSRDQVVGGHSLVTAMPDEGRTHQIRRHLESIGHPILGDHRYGDPKSNRYLEHKHNLDRPFLHCAAITLTAPTTGEQITFEAPLAADLNAVLASMRS